MIAFVEEVSSSLVREFLSRKGLRKTIACMDEEHPRTATSINNRSLLRQVLNMEDLYRKNKLQVQNPPLKTLLEIIVKHHMEQQKKHKISTGEPASPATSAESSLICDTEEENITASYDSSRSEIKATRSSPSTFLSLLSDENKSSGRDQKDVLAYDPEHQKYQPPTSLQQESESSVQKEPEKKSEVIPRSRTNRNRRGVMSAPIPRETGRKFQSPRYEVSQPLFRREGENQCSFDGYLVKDERQRSLERSKADVNTGGKLGLQRSAESLQSENNNGENRENKAKTVNKNHKPNFSDLNVSELVLDDVDDEDLQELSQVSPLRSVSERLPESRPIDQNTAADLKAVLLGTSLNCFSAEWRNQGLTFSETHDLRYGIVQRKGGPCGVLASIQAFVLKKLLFENAESSDSDLQRLRPSNATRRKCLLLALAEVLWKAGEEKQATVAVNSGLNQFTPSGRYRSDGVLEKMVFFTVDNLKDLQVILEQHIEQFETGTLGCLLLTVSAVLSRSIEKVRDDMDVSTSTLIGAHGYCTQELVSLLLCGRAVSNVFDDDMELDSGDGNITLLKGIKNRCDVGLLSLFEHYNICKRELLTSEDRHLEFDLYYYDGLANQQEEIRLTVTVGKWSFQEVDSDSIPPLELCIRTRWKNVEISWNDTEPIL
ncbi:probable ubiquitin carboxyl-terminal hydrolase MINDY-4 isoform X2 [Oryzias melastigma]|uniref:probable ubiquitin carboxyl-terminal hydrolase MINDY-4 isoform X2 n=1 Tax=Oryzias melastigma TaxID=30732 RepID=UPI00168CE716|nr:probable ubiquitin carboxyl-terminal hydrolase MINDY-4 isoform X2 [Oryzias melastigma]